MNLNKINKFRRALMFKLTDNIGKSQNLSHLDLTKKPQIKRVLICRPNHRLGNLLLITPLVQDVVEMFPDCKIDLFIKGNLGPIVFENYTNVDLIIKLPKKPFKHILQYINVWFLVKKHRYDLVINAVPGSSSGRLATKFARSKYKIFGDTNQNSELEKPSNLHIAKEPVFAFRNFLELVGYGKITRSIPVINIKLKPEELKAARQLLEAIVGNDNKTISIFTFATGKKCYSENWWNDFYNSLKKTYPNYNIVEVLPIENVSQIGFKAPTFYSKDVREIAAFIANTEIFIGADSGIMHLASSSLSPTVGLFSVTKEGKYSPYGNGSIALNTNECTTDVCIEAISKILFKVNTVSNA